MEIDGRFLSGFVVLLVMATWAGLLLPPMVGVGVLMVVRGRPAARWLLLLPIVWLAPLAAAMGISTAEQSAAATGLGYLALAVCGLIAPTFAWHTRTLSALTVSWLGLNVLVTFTALALIGLFPFTT
ncbi:hypothetical protein LRS10_16460 [Phenylobacterium sp. J426]|uniref:hypothetical protein n=1 Tax=Phenylobacterium sp. J426 TaxID=2898439 RepID=UPI002151D142|nr:hypothetical protein [Phenylobacterium sp. J426]MCR5875627.1 hypothetical protein [Phenylobacterium sp. J426]